MTKIAKVALYLSFFLVSACVGSQKNLDPEVSNFIRLLVQAEAPTLAEYSKFSGECGGESELSFELNECRSRGWDINSESCIEFTRQRCNSADNENSLVLSWIREQFSTVGKSYHLVGIESRTEGFSHNLVDVLIGDYRFRLFHNIDPNKPTGVVVGVLEINGKSMSDYLEN